MTDAPASTEHTPAGFWRRFVAFNLDLTIFSPLYLVIALFIDYRSVWADGIFYTTLLLVYAAMFSSKWQASPGMRCMHVYAVTKEGYELSFLHALVWGAIAGVCLLLCIGPLYLIPNSYDGEAAMQALSSIGSTGIVDLDDPMLTKAFGMPPMEYMAKVVFGIGFSLIASTVWALTIALSRNKTGIHNLLCGTRIVKGRTNQKLF